MKIKIIHFYLLILGFIFLFAMSSNAQRIKWLRINELQSPINEIGAEFENEFPTGNTNFFSWPAQYSIDQNTTRMKGLWIGSQNFLDPFTMRNVPAKVVASGPRNPDEWVLHIFPQELKLVGKSEHPTVIVDGAYATSNDQFDVLDEVDPDMPADRMVIVKFNTSIGISVTKKVMAFDHPDHDNYFINEYTFKNTGIYDAAGNEYQQTLNDVYFYWVYRYAFAGVTSDGWGSTWGAFASTWGNSTINHAFGNNPAASEFNNTTSPFYQLRAFYSYYGPSADRTTVTYNEDWGCPDENGDGVLGSAKYAGCVTLHADTGPANSADDLSQPSTTWFISSDINSMLGVASTPAVMDDRYTIMSEGDPPDPHSVVVEGDYPINYADDRRNSGGGTSQGQGYGPYTMQYGDSIKIIFAEGVSGISWETSRMVGANWLSYFNGSGSPALVNPDGSPETDHNVYKNNWIETGVDSIIQTYNNARYNYEQGYNIAKPPSPPETFTVESGGNAISLSWADNAMDSPNFDGYVIYRSAGNVLDWETEYEKIFECNGTTTLTHEYADTTALRGFDYYYYIQSKSDGQDNELNPGTPLYSSLFWTITNLPANLQRPPADYLYEVRVVPNPYDIRARKLQFGDESQFDRIAFFGLPDKCRITVLTERGDIVWRKTHTNGTGDELWDSKTSSGQIVVSGVYILHVEVTEDIKAREDRYAMYPVYDEKLNLVYNTGELMHQSGDLIYKKGQSTFRKFVIIR